MQYSVTLTWENTYSSLTNVFFITENPSKRPDEPSKQTKEYENNYENKTPKSYKEVNTIKNESHMVLIENGINTQSNQYIPEKRSFIQPIAILASVLIGITIITMIIYLIESIYGSRIDVRKEKTIPGW